MADSLQKFQDRSTLTGLDSQKLANPKGIDR
jgi:hypothetical protein